MTWTLAFKMGLVLTTGALAVTVMVPAPTAAGAAAAADDSSLRLAGVRFGAATQLVVSVPPNLVRQALPASAFHVTQDGSGLPLTVQRVTDSGLDVYVVLDTGAPRATLAAEQSAAVELLRNLPPAVRTAAVGSDAAGSAVSTAQPGNITALRDLSMITPQSTTSPNPTLTAIAALPADGRRRAIILLTDCHAAAAARLQPFAASLGRGDHDQQLDVVAPGIGCPHDLPSLATRAGGLAVAGQSLAHVDQALDTVLLDLLGQYRLTVPASAKGRSLTITVDQAGVRASTIIGAAALPRSGAAAGSAHKAGGMSRALLAALVVLVVVLAIAAVAIAIRRRAPAGTPVPPTAAQAAREAAGPPPFRPVVQAAAGPSPERPPDKPAGWFPPALPDFVSTGVTDQTVRVRLPELADVPALRAYAEQGGGMADGWVPMPAGDAEPDWIALVDSWLQTWRAGPGGGALSLLVERCADRRVVGYVGLRVSLRAADVSFGTAPPWRGNGYATRSLRLIADWLADDDPARTIQAMIPPEHDASCNVARQAGFHPTGVTRTFVPETGRVELDLRYVFRLAAAGEPQ